MVSAGPTGEALAAELAAWQHAGGLDDQLADEGGLVAAVEEGHFGLDLAKATKLAAADFEHEPGEGASEKIAGGIELVDACAQVAAAGPPKAFAAGDGVVGTNDGLLLHGRMEAVSETED